MATQSSPLRKQFEVERRRSAFMCFLAGTGIGIIVTDNWINALLGIPGGLLTGGVAYGLVYGYETLMWKRHHAR